MKRIVKNIAAMLLIAMCLTSDTAATSVVLTSRNWSVCVFTIPMPRFLVCQNWTPRQAMLPFV